MIANEVLITLIKRFEGLRLKAYRCPAGVWTNGYGSTGKDITPSTQWTKEYAEYRMQSDAMVHLSAAKKLCPSLKDASLGAIADFSYNLGATRLAGSTLRRKLNSGDIDGAKIELSKWVRSGTRILPGLVLRRKAESNYL